MRWRWSSVFGPQLQQSWRAPQPGCPRWAPSPGQTSTPSAWQHSSIWRYWRRIIWSEDAANSSQTLYFSHKQVIKSNMLTITRKRGKSFVPEKKNYILNLYFELTRLWNKVYWIHWSTQGQKGWAKGLFLYWHYIMFLLIAEEFKSTSI